MSERHRLIAYAVIILAMLGVGAAWSVDKMFAAREVARRAAVDLEHARGLAEDIRQLRREPAVAAAELLGSQRLGEQIELASRKSGFPARPEGVQPRTPVRVGETPYLRQPTEVDFRRVTLPQIIPFLYYLTEDSGLEVSDLRFRAPRGESGGNAWDVDATLTYLIYSPADRGPRGG